MSEKKRPRGFAAMDPERRKEIAARGGRAVKPENRAFSTNRDLASAAGVKGGRSVPPEKRSFSVNPEIAKAAGLKGGHSKKKI